MKNYFSDQRTITFLISLLIATILWLLIKLSGDFQTEQKVQLNFQNFPIDKIFINKPDSVLQIRTNNNGFDILGQRLFYRNKSININFNKAKHLKTKSGIQSYYIVSNNFREEIEAEFKTAEQILSIKPDSLVFEFEKLASKKLKIELQLDLNFNPRFKQHEKLQFEPESIEVFGPKSILDSLLSIKTQKLSLQGINSNIDTSLKLLLPSKQLTIKYEKVRIRMGVEEYTEGKIKLPIQIAATAKVNYKVFPAEAQITYQVALKDYASIDPNAFEIRATPDPTEPGKLLLHLSKQPANVIVSLIQPSTAEYIILK